MSMLVKLDDDQFGSLAFWEQAELAMRMDRDPEPVTTAEWRQMRVNAAKAWIESSNRDFTVRKKHDVRNRKVKV